MVGAVQLADRRHPHGAAADQRVLAVGRLGTPQVWDPVSGKFTAAPPPAWLFCAGQTLLPDGRVFFAGGHIDYDHGLPNTTIFNPATNTWSSSVLMARGRWYPTTTTLANGDVLILAGRDQASVNVLEPEIWSNGTIRRLTTASNALPYYPRAFLTPKGTVFVAGQVLYSRYLVTTGTGYWKGGPTHLYPTARDYGSAVMYETGRILYAGGARTTNTAEVIDLNAVTPAWKWTAPMAFSRRHLNLTTLPTGEVLATGGVGGTVFNDPTKAVYAAEMWNPGTGQWTTLSSNAVMRDYHGTALLMPDGRVLVAGGSESAGAPDQKNAEFFSPPYLFRGARPTINSAPATLRYGQTFRILTADAGSIAKVSLIRLATVTHAFDENGRASGSCLRRTPRGSRSRPRPRAISRRQVTTWYSSSTEPTCPRSQGSSSSTRRALSCRKGGSVVRYRSTAAVPWGSGASGHPADRRQSVSASWTILPWRHAAPDPPRGAGAGDGMLDGAQARVAPGAGRPTRQH